MRTLALCIVAGIALGGCAAETREYEMSEEQARSKLLATDFEKGTLPGSSNSWPIVHENSQGNLEWQISSTKDLAHASGWWCPIAIEPVGEDGKKIRVVNQCEGPFSRNRNRDLDELVDATLTGRAPQFD